MSTTSSDNTDAHSMREAHVQGIIQPLFGLIGRMSYCIEIESIQGCCNKVCNG